MSRLLQGSEGFYYAYKSVRKNIPIETMARVTRAGALRFVVDHYEVHAPPAENEWVYPGELEDLLDLDSDEDRGFHEATSHDVQAREMFDLVVESEVKNNIEPLMEHYGDTLEWISLVVAVQYRLLEDEWDDMIAYLNGILPKDNQLTMEELQTFDSDCLQEFDPELHEADRDNGTFFLQYFLDHEEHGIAYLGFRVLVHAIQHELEVCDIDDEPRWQRTFYPEGDEDDEDDEAEGEKAE